MRARLWIPALTSVVLGGVSSHTVKGAELPVRFQVIQVARDLGVASEATAINQAGEVAGWVTSAEGTVSAFVHRGGRSTRLPTPSGFFASRALGLNDRGEVVGFAVRKQRSSTADTGVAIPGEQEIRHAVIWKDGVCRDLGVGEARDLNNHGEIVGLNARWRDGKTREPLTADPLVAQFNARAISENGFIAGSAKLTGSRIGRPALLRNRQLDLLDDSAGGPEGTALDVNAKAVAVGLSSVLDGEAFLWVNGKQTLLGTMNGAVQYGFGGHAGFHYSIAYAVNERAQVVGAGNVSERGFDDLHAFLWERGRLTDLNRLVPPGAGWTLTEAHGINDRGEICGVGLHQGKRRAFLLVSDP